MNDSKRILHVARGVTVAVATLYFLSVLVCPRAFAIESAASTTVATASGCSTLQATSLESAESAVRIFYAAGLGSILGYERSSSSQKAGAGVRTMAL
eukprot:7000481-Ditylum_brightwellii.AAC.1